jgi:phage tail tape measure protein, TP901 family|nr:MAG TPA: minor tail protein [Caudoviricetes sp.]
MSEELRIEVDVKAKDDSAKNTLDGLIKEYNNKPLEFQVKLGKFDISGISSSIARLTSDLNKLTNIEFNGLNKLETNLKNINKLMSQQNKISNNGVDVKSNAENGVKRLLGDQKESLRHLEELDQISKEMDSMLSQYNKNNEKAFKEFAKKNEDSLQYIDLLKNSSSEKAFRNVIKYKEQLDKLQKEFSSLGVQTVGQVSKVFELDSGEMGRRTYNGGYEDIIGQSSERFERAVAEARKLSSKISTAKSNIKKNLDKISDDEKEIIDHIENLSKNLIPVDSTENHAIESQLKQMLENYLSLDDLKDLDLNIPNDLFIAYERFIKNFKEMKQEYKSVFGADEDFIKLNAFDGVQNVIDNLEKATNNINLDNLREKLTNAFDIDEKVIANIEKIENALKQLNSMSELTQKSLFSEGVFKTGEQLNLENKIKEYLNLDKQINDAFTKLSKAELNRSNDVVASLNKEIDLLRQKQALTTLDLRSNGGFNDETREQIRLQEELNKAISQTQQAEYKNSFIDKLHQEAKKANEEFDEIRKQQEKISSFEMPEVFDTKGIKSYVDYLDSAADGIKRILTQNLGSPGRDITTTLYGDGTEVRKVVNNIEKSVNQLSTAYKQVDNEITRLVKSKDKLEASGDNKTAQILEKQIVSWKEMQQGIENAAKSAKVYDQVMEKVQNTVLKNSNSIDTNKSQVEFKLDVNHDNAVRKVNEFKTKMLSNLQELERKYKGTQMFDQVVREVEKFKTELKGLDSYLENVSKVDMSHLSGEFRRINQDLTQTKRDLSDMSNTMKSNFFDDLYDSMRTFTLGNIIGDAIQDGVSAIKDTIVNLDSALRDMMKVAPSSFQGTTEQLKAVKNDAVEVAKVVGQSSEDVIQGMAKALQTGAKTMGDALEIAKASATFANVGDLSQGQADTYIASIMSSYGGMTNALKPVREEVQGMSKDYNNLTKFLDLANHAGNNFAISTGDVGEALMRSGSVLSEFGVSMQDAISMIVGANESVQDAEKVGTAIKTMATNLGGVKAAAKDGSLEMNRTAKALQTIAGIDIYSNKQKGEIKDMMTILKELNVVWDDLSEDKQLAIAESIAGKNHINTLMAMMGNWETVLQYQEDYNNGFTIGSAQREQERYLNSIEGKWNTLKENLKNLVTTTISSDFAKGFLDGAISFTDGLNSALKVLDQFNAVLPATIGLITSLGQSFRVLSGNGSIELFGSGMINGIKSFNEALKGTTINYSTTNSGIQKLANNQTKLSKSTTKTSDSFKQYSLRVGDASQSIVRINRENTTLAKSQTKVAGGMKNVISSFTQSAAGSKLAMVGTSLLNGALIGLASWGIGQAITAFDNYINRHKIAAEEARESIDVINGEIQGYQSQKKSLESISKEYDSLAKKTNKTASELERFSELKNEIANIMPELVIGYDENNDPILAMNGNVQDLIKELDRAVESKQRLLESKENDLGINATENIKKAAKELESSYTSMKLALQGGSITSNNALSDKNWWGGEISIKERTQKVIKALEDEEKAYNERYNEHLANLEEYYAREQEIQKKNLNEIFKKDSYKALQDDLKGNVNSFAALFDWGEYDLSGQKQMVRGIEDLTKAVAEGKIDLEDFNTRWQSINDTFQNTGDIDQYNKSINELAKELEKATGVEVGKWVEGLNQQFEGLSYADAKLNKFLQSYNSSLDQLRNGDSLAINLKKQFEELARFSDLIDSEFIATGKIDVELLAEVKESESFKYLPQQIQTAIDGIISDNKATEAEQDILLRLKTIIQNEGALDDDVSEQLNRLFQGKSTQQELEIGIKIGDYHIPPDLMKILNSEYEGKNTEINFKINTENIEKLDEITQKRDELNGSITESTHKVKTEGTEELEKTNEIHDGSNGKITESTHKINSEGAEEVKNDIDEINKGKKELEKPTNLSINKGELQGSVDEFNKLIEYSTKLKDGEYQISFKSDTADAIAQIENLKLAVNNLSNQFMQIPSTTITLNTSLAAKNLSGLIVRINQTKEALGNLSSKDVNINTAQSAKNLSGLITRVNEYKAAADNAKTATFNAETAQAAKNMSGLIAKINATNTAAGSTKTINFKTNATSVANQVKSLASAVKSVPNGKTITYSIKTNGSVPKVSSPRSVFTMEGQGESLASVASYDATSVDSESLMSARASSSEMLVSNNPIASPMLRKISSTDAKNMFDYDVDIFKKLENSLKKISNELDIISKKSENAFGQEKINYLQKQIELLKQQQQLQHSLAEDMRVQQDVLKNYLLGKGFTFDAEDNISNYSQKLLAYEKYVKSLENKANSNKDNDKIQAQYDGAKKDLDEIKNALNSYLDLTFSKIPNASKEWWDMEESIKDCISEIEQLKISLKNIDASINIGKYEGTLNKVQREINRLDEDIERAFGKRKEELIQKKIELIRQEQQELHKLANSYRDQARTYGEYLSGFGFKFDSSGMITNLENIKNLTNDARYEVIKEALEEYINLTQSKIPNLSEEWWDLQDSIESAKDKIEEARKELEKFLEEAKIDVLVDEFNDLAHKIDLIDKKLKHATGKDKLDLMSEKLELIKKQQIEVQKHLEFYNSKKSSLQGYLGGLGFEFDSDGDITNYVQQLEKIANSSSDFEEVKEKLEEYFKIQNDELPGLESEWQDLENAYKDTLKEQLETTQEIEKKITEIYKKQIEDRIDAMNKETDEKVKNLKKQQDAYNQYRDEVDYKNEYEDKLSEINDIQRQLDIAMRDSSLQGQKKVKELQKLLADAQKDLDKFTQDKIDSDVNDAFEAEADRITESNKNAIEQLEKEWSDSKIAEMVSQAISSGIFEGIDGEISNLQDAMLEFAESTGELFGVMGTVIKSELITNLGIAMETFRDLDSILKGLNLDKFATLSNTVKLDLSAANVSPAKSSNVEFNAPLINIEGNVNNDVMENLKTYQDQITKDIIKQISSSIR